MFMAQWSKPTANYRDPHTVHHPRFGEVWHIKCPFCEKRRPDLGPDKGFHCMVRLEPEKFSCIRCGTNGGIKFLISNGNVESEVPDIEGEYQKIQSQKPKSYGWDIGMTIRISGLDKTHVAWEFLRKDGFTDNQIEYISDIFGILYCPKGKQVGRHESNTTSHRLIFPLRGEGGEMSNWQARWLPSAMETQDEEWKIAKKLKTSKYLISPGFQKMRFPYNKKEAWENESIVVVEGVKKVWKTGPFSIGTFGMQAGSPPPPDKLNPETRPWFADALAEGKRLIFLFDRSGMQSAMELALWYVSHGGNAHVVPLPQDGPDDLDDYSTHQIHAMLREYIKEEHLPQALRKKGTP